MSRIKLVDAIYDENTGISSVKISTNFGNIEKFVKVAEADKDIANQFDGCYIAEFDCHVEMYRRKARALYQRYIGAKELIDTWPQLENMCGKKIEDMHKRYKEANDKYHSLLDMREKVIAENEQTRRKILEYAANLDKKE